MQWPTSAVNVLAVISLWSACATETKFKTQRRILQILLLFSVQTLSQMHDIPSVFVCIHPSHHCLHSPCSQVSPTLSSWLSWRQRGGQGPGSQDLCWTSSNWQSVPSDSGTRDLTHNSTFQFIVYHLYICHYKRHVSLRGWLWCFYIKQLEVRS